jgi:hypothetical protein
MKKEHMLLVATLGLAFMAIPAFANDRALQLPGAGILVPKVPMTSTTTKDALVPVIKIKKDKLQEVKREAEAVRKETRKDIKEIRGEARQEIDEAREGLRDDVKTIRQNVFASTTMGIVTPEMKRAIEERREEFKHQLEEKKDEVKTKIETEKLRLNEKLKSIKDERKKQTVQKVNTEIQALNARKLEHYSNVLNQIEEVLKKVGTRVDNASARGLEVGTMRTNMTAVETAITTARTAIIAQSAKVYTVTVTTEGKLKNDTGVTRQQLQKDLSVVQNLVKMAHEALRKTAVSLAQIPRINNGSATSTATTTNQTGTTTATSTATTTTTN